jgi:hypothetical protein
MCHLGIYLLFSRFLFVDSRISNSEYDYGVLYSTNSSLDAYHVNFQNCTIADLTSGSTIGGAVTSFPSAGGTVEILGCSFSNINLTNTSATSGGFIYIGTAPQFIHIHDSNFSFATVWI